LATKQHSTLIGSDLHLTKIDATTGTELTPSSQTTYDGRYVRTIGGTITPAANSTTTLQVTKQDGTTQVFDVDTTNARVGLLTASPGATLDIGTNVTFTTTPRLRVLGTSGDAAAALIEVGDGSGAIWARFMRSSGNQLSLDQANFGSYPFKFNGYYQFGGSVAFPIVNKTAAYTLGNSDMTVTADASGGTFQVTLPDATTVVTLGRYYTIKRTSASNNVTVGTTSSQTVEGATTKTLGSQWSSVTVQSTGSDWIILNQFGTVT